MIVALGQGLLAAGLIAATGSIATEASESLRARPFPIWLAYAFVAGVVATGGCLFAFSHVGGIALGPSSIRGFFLAATTVALLLAIRRRRRNDSPPRAYSLERLDLPAFALLGLVSVGVMLGATADPVIDIDGRVTWHAHAEYVRHQGTVDADALRDRSTMVAHPRYPPSLPVVQTAVLDLWETEDERALKPIYTLFFPAFVLLLFDATRSSGIGRGATLVTAVATTLPFPALALDGGALGLYSDLPLATAVLGATTSLYVHGRGRENALIAGLLLAGCILTKNEGLLLAGAVLTGWTWTAGGTIKHPERRPWVAPALCLSVVAMATALLVSWKSGIPNRLDESYLSRLSIERLTADLREAPLILRSIARQAVDLEAWGILWPCLLLVLLLGARRIVTNRTARAMITVPAIAHGALLVTYLATGWPREELIRVTWDRVSLQVLGPLLVAAALSLPAGRPGSTLGSRRPGRDADPLEG